MARRLNLHPIWWFFGIPLALVVAWLAWFLLDLYVIHTRVSDRYLIPDGYIGPVKIEFSVPGAPKLRIEGGRRIFSIGADGALRTSSTYEETFRRKGYGWGTDDYFYIDGNHLTPLRDCAWCEGETIWATSFHYPHVSGALADNLAGAETFFVGAKSDFCELDPGKVNSVCK